MHERRPGARLSAAEPEGAASIAARTEFLFFAALFSGAAMLLYVSAIVSLDGLQERDEWIVYALLFSAFPVAAVVLSRIGNRTYTTMLFVWNGAVLTALLAYLIIQPSLDALTGGGIRLPAMRPGVLLALSLLHFTGVLALGLPQIRREITALTGPAIFVRLARLLMVLAPLLLAAFIIVYSTWEAPIGRSWLIHRVIGDWRFDIYLIVGAVLAALAFRLAAEERRLSAWKPELHRGLGLAALGLVFVFNLLLFDDGLWADMMHFRAVVEPALHFRHGGIPLVDVHSQYGLLPYLLIAWGYEILPVNYSSASLVVRLANVAYLAVFVALVYRLCGNKITAVALAAFGLLLHITYYPVNLWIAPSVGGLRYLLPMAMVLALAYLPRDRQHSPWTLAILVLSSFWSLETFVFSAGPYAAFLIGNGMFRRRVLASLGQSLFLVAAIAAAHLLFVGFMLAYYGKLPRYDFYFDLISAYSTHTPDFLESVSPYYWVWAINATVYFLVLCCFLHRALTVRSRQTPAADWWLVSALLPTAAVGILFASYFVARSTYASLYLAQLPLFAVVLAAADRLLWRNTESFRSRRSLQVVLVLAVGIVSAVGLEKFFQPHGVHAGNSTILRQCFLASGCAPSRILAQLSERLSSPPPGTELDTERIYQLQLQHWTKPPQLDIIRDGYRLAQTLGRDEERLAIFLDYDRFPITGTVLMYADRWHKWPISSAYLDLLSPKLTNYIVSRPIQFREDEVVITLADEDRLEPLHQTLLGKIREQWSLCPVAETESGVVAYRTSRDAACGSRDGR